MTSPLALTLGLFFLARGAQAEDGIRVWSTPVAGSDVPWSAVEALIDAPADVVWELVSNCDNYEATMPSIANAKELSRKGDVNSSFETVCEVTADLPFPLPDLTSVSRANHKVTPGASYVRSWTMLRGDYDYNEGSWSIAAVNPRQSKATYKLRVRPKMPVPDSMLGTFQAGTMPKIIKGLRVKAAALAAKRPPPAPPAAPATPKATSPEAPPSPETPPSPEAPGATAPHAP